MNPRDPAVNPPRPAYFRYCGSTSLAGVGSVTGAYTFSGAGSAVAVDPQDAALPRRCAAPGPNQLGTSNRKWHVVPRICGTGHRSEEHTSELQSHLNLVCRLLLEKKKIDTSNLYYVLKDYF